MAAESGSDEKLIEQRISDRVNHVWRDATHDALIVNAWPSMEDLSHCLEKFQSSACQNFNILLICATLDNSALRKLISKYRNVSLIQNQSAINFAETINSEAAGRGNHLGCQILLADKTLTSLIEASFLHNRLLAKRNSILIKIFLGVKNFLRPFYQYFAKIKR